MSDVLFSSWDGRVLDNRKAAAKKDAGAGVPTKLNGHPVAAIIGWNGLVVIDGKADIPSLALAYLREARKLSCGECSVCQIGIDRMIEMLEKMAAGKGKKEDLAEMERVIKGVSELSKCNFGRASALVPVLDAIRYYGEEFQALAAGRRKLQKKAYASAVTAPCMAACPASLDIPGYIELIRNNKFVDSLNLIRERCILPGVIGRACTHPCEAACVRNDIDETLAIRLLKRAAADYDRDQGGSALGAPAKEKDDKVAVIGAGPAGLAVAYHLRLRGYGVTIFEALPKGGGMASVGIPDYRLPKDVLGQEIDLIRGMGVKIEYNRRIDRFDLEDMKRQGFKAVFIGVGAHTGAKIGCKGEEAACADFVQGADFLRDLSLGKKIEPKKKVVIIGGGNVAIDCARSCLRLGFGEVEILYRRSRKEMPANEEEIEQALEEGVKIQYLVAPLCVFMKEGKVTTIECQKMKLGEPDESGRRRPIPVPGSEYKAATEMVVAATGQVPDLSFVVDRDQLGVTGWGTIKADPLSFRTQIDGVFAGGDCVLGPATLIEALDAGNKAARSIDAYIQGKTYDPGVSFKGIEVGKQRVGGYVAERPEEKVTYLDPAVRGKSFAEVEGGYNPSQAIKEAQRCLRCYRLVVWE
jgi:formate dehydrogenase (NADP+) beta subunit